MASKRRLRRRGCTSKVRHKTKGAAMEAVRELSRAGRYAGQVPYRCKLCGGWHNGRRKQWHRRHR